MLYRHPDLVRLIGEPRMTRQRQHLITIPTLAEYQAGGACGLSGRPPRWPPEKSASRFSSLPYRSVIEYIHKASDFQVELRTLEAPV